MFHFPEDLSELSLSKMNLSPSPPPLPPRALKKSMTYTNLPALTYSNLPALTKPVDIIGGISDSKGAWGTRRRMGRAQKRREL